jgi:hypothetical protein
VGATGIENEEKEVKIGYKWKFADSLNFWLAKPLLGTGFYACKSVNIYCKISGISRTQHSKALILEK